MIRLPTKKKIRIFIIVFLVISILGAIIGMLYFNKLANAKYYKVAGQNIPTIANVVGKRKISSFSGNCKNSVWHKNYEYYQVKSPVEDVQEYVEYMIEEEGYGTNTKIDTNIEQGQVILNKKSSDATEKDITLKIKYYSDKYSIFIKVQ